MTGDILARELVKIRPDIPIIPCSEFTRDFNPATYKKMGIQVLLTKPFSIEEIGKSIRSVLDRLTAHARPIKI
jgi:DNA-binding response OmpR family regulator